MGLGGLRIAEKETICTRGRGLRPPTGGSTWAAKAQESISLGSLALKGKTHLLGDKVCP